MEIVSDPETIFKEKLTKLLLGLKNQLNSKKYIPITARIDQHLESINNPSFKGTIINPFFDVIKLAFDIKGNTKIIEFVTDSLKQIIALKMMNPLTKDQTYYLHLDEREGKIKFDKEKAGNDPRNFVDTIIDCVCSIPQEKNFNDNLQLAEIQILLNLTTSNDCNVHGSHLISSFVHLFRIYMSAKNQVNQLTAKNALIQVTNSVFKKMEEFEESRRGSLTKSMTSDMLGGGRFQSLTEMVELYTENQQPPQISESQQKLIESACATFVTNLIDDVCLYNAKCETISLKHSHDKALSEEMRIDKIKKDILNLPMRSCPSLEEANDERFKKKISLKILNEKGENAGEFGWCLVCRKGADKYCKDLRVPICSPE